MLTYSFSEANERIAERVVDDGRMVIGHVILPPGDELPTHETDLAAYFVVVRGEIEVVIDAGEALCPSGTILNLPAGTEMKVANSGETVAEFFVAKPKKEGPK